MCDFDRERQSNMGLYCDFSEHICNPVLTFGANVTHVYVNPLVRVTFRFPITYAMNKPCSGVCTPKISNMHFRRQESQARILLKSTHVPIVSCAIAWLLTTASAWVEETSCRAVQHSHRLVWLCKRALLPLGGEVQDHIMPTLLW